MYKVVYSTCVVLLTRSRCHGPSLHNIYPQTMAKKRRAETVEPSDANSYSESSTSSKRARIEDEDAVPQKKRVNNLKGKGKMGKGKMDASRESDDEGECTAPHITTEQDDDEFEATQGERIRKDIEAGNQRTGVSIFVVA